MAKPKTVHVSRESLERLRTVGHMMSNFCYNMAQPSWEWDERFRKNLDEMRKAWDVEDSRILDEIKGKGGA